MNVEGEREVRGVLRDSASPLTIAGWTLRPIRQPAFWVSAQIGGDADSVDH